MARMGLLSEGELEWDDVFEDAAGDTGGALVLGWASRRRLQHKKGARRRRRRQRLMQEESEGAQGQWQDGGEEETWT
jgi:hypothetical protein